MVYGRRSCESATSAGGAQGLGAKLRAKFAGGRAMKTASVLVVASVFAAAWGCGGGSVGSSNVVSPTGAGGAGPGAASGSGGDAGAGGAGGGVGNGNGGT